MDFKKNYAETKATAETFEGYMGDLSIAIFQSIFDYQNSNKITGDMIEFGVYKGKSASVQLRNLNPGDTAYLVDIHKVPEFDKLDHINKQYKFILGKGNTLSQTDDFAKSVPSSYRFSHHDASHNFDNVMAEMAFMEGKIKPRGLMVLDDFLNPVYLQVVAACFEYLASTKSTMEFLLFADNKAYLCHKEDFDFYATFVFNTLLHNINSVGMNCQLARTDDSPRFRGFGIRRKRAPTDNDHYIVPAWGMRYYQNL